MIIAIERITQDLHSSETTSEHTDGDVDESMVIVYNVRECYTVTVRSNLRLEPIIRFKLLRYCFLLSPGGTIKLQGGLQSSVKET